MYCYKFILSNIPVHKKCLYLCVYFTWNTYLTSKTKIIICDLLPFQQGYATADSARPGTIQGYAPAAAQQLETPGGGEAMYVAEAEPSGAREGIYVGEAAEAGYSGQQEAAGGQFQQLSQFQHVYQVSEIRWGFEIGF